MQGKLYSQGHKSMDFCIAQHCNIGCHPQTSLQYQPAYHRGLHISVEPLDDLAAELPDSQRLGTPEVNVTIIVTQSSGSEV